MKQNTMMGRLMRRLTALALAAALVLSLAGCQDLAALMGQNTTASAASPATTPAEGSSFTVNFIDVGQALSVLVTCDGQSMLYDGGNVADGSLVVSYHSRAPGVSRLEYVICSHAHEDHVGGLAAVLAKFPAGHVYAPVTENDTQCFQDFVKYTQQQGLSVEIPRWAPAGSWAAPPSR